MKGQLMMMETDIESSLKTIKKVDFDRPHPSSHLQTHFEKTDKFFEFKRERNFKRKLIAFLLEKVD